MISSPLPVFLAVLALTACATTPPLAPASPPPAPEPAAPPPPTPHALVVEPPLSTVEIQAWAGISLFDNLISYGFSADSKVFANCHADANPALFTKGCDLVHLDTGAVEHVASKTSYGAGESPKADPALSAVLGPLGVPAPRGSWLSVDPLVVAWTTDPAAGGDHDLVVFTLRNGTSGRSVELARFERAREKGLRVYPRDVLLSPDGHRLALVVSLVGGPPLVTDARIVDADAMARAVGEPGT